MWGSDTEKIQESLPEPVVPNPQARPGVSSASEVCVPLKPVMAQGEEEPSSGLGSEPWTTARGRLQGNQAAGYFSPVTPLLE